MLHFYEATSLNRNYIPLNLDAEEYSTKLWFQHLLALKIYTT